MTLQNKVVLVTGSISKGGIGEAIALLCLEQGAKVMFHGLSWDEEHAKELVAPYAGMGRASYMVADLSDPQNCKKLIAATIDSFGTLDCLVNNAATTQRCEFDKATPRTFDEIMAINAKAPFFLAQGAVRQFKLNFELNQSGGRILNIGSVNDHGGEKVLIQYAMSKAALKAMTRNLADTVELAQQGIYVNQLNLGWVSSGNEMRLKLAEGWPTGWQEKLPSQMAPSGKLLTPQQIAQHALFWISGQAGPVNGSVVDVEQFPLIPRLNGGQGHCHSRFFGEVSGTSGPLPKPQPPQIKANL